MPGKPRKKKLQDVQTTPQTLKTQADYIHESVSGDGGIPPAPPQSDQSHDPKIDTIVEAIPESGVQIKVTTQTPDTETPECGFITEGVHAGPVLMRTDKRKLPCILTIEEKLERGLDLVGTFHKIAAEKLRQTQLKKEMAAALTTMEEEQTRLGKAIETGEEDREVDVDLYMLPGNETVSEVRRDTAKPVATRPVTDFERQAVLFGPEKADEMLDHLMDHEEGDNGATPEE